MEPSAAVRPAAVAGLFYPADPPALGTLVESLLAEAKPPRDTRMPSALIVPHAGYVYSGAIAASAYACLAGVAPGRCDVLLLGPAHRARLDGLALPHARALRTPLGDVPIAEEIVAQIAARPGVTLDDVPHVHEHSLEVQLPFLQTIFAELRVVPILAGRASAEMVADVMLPFLDRPAMLVVVSSDLSHYLPYDVASRIDSSTARTIVECGPQPLTHDQACGATPINGLLLAARRAELRATLLDLRSSGDTAGGRDEVVGYAAFRFDREAAA